MRPTKPMRPPGMGMKNMENRRVRNRRYKSKSILAQPEVFVHFEWPGQWPEGFAHFVWLG